jgi:thiopeptide-type bacteriocin biosynthesis protein
LRDKDEDPDFVPSGFFVLRTPLLAFDELVGWSEGAGADRATLRRRLASLVARPECREALFLASPSLEESLDHWLHDPESERGAKVEHSLVKYLSRMSGRATPYGTFAGCSTGTLGDATRLVLGETATCRRHTRLDGEYLSACAARLAADPAIRAALRYRPNDSLYRCAGQVRYAARRQIATGTSYELVAVEATPHLDAALETARGGASLSEIASAVARAVSASMSAASELVSRLVEAQVVVSDVEPIITGPEPIDDLIQQLSAIEPARDHVHRLELIRERLAKMDGAGLGAPPPLYRELAREVAELGAKIEPAHLFQVDMTKPFPGLVLGGEVVREVARAIEILHRIAPRRPDELEAFRAAFLRRYEGREVPLVHVLDEESGLGFGLDGSTAATAEPLIRGIAFPPADEETLVRWGAREEWLQERLAEVIARGEGALSLDERDLDALASHAREATPLPDALAARAILGASDRAPGFTLFVLEVGGPSGANLIGRFCHADATLRRHVEEHLRAEERHRPDALFAEIVHLPEGRLGNIIQRPVLRSHEIPFLGRSGAPAAAQIPVGDLLVSVVGGRVRLRSARLGREVLPRLTSALNVGHRSSQGLHRFLAALQTQGIVPGLGWSWGPLETAPFLPRVVSGPLVLALARWNLAGDTLERALASRGPERTRAVEELRAQRRLPRLVALADLDNVLPVDLENALSVDAFLHLAKGRRRITLTEVFPGPDGLVVRGPGGRFVHELIVPFVRRLAAPRSAPPLPRPSRGQRLFPPGSEWLYAKLYAGVATADHLLKKLVAPLVRETRSTGAVDRWFFIRYADPDPHVRLRFHGEPGRLTGEVLRALHEAAAPHLDRGSLNRLQLDTYERELERYGTDEGIALAEELFEADSDLALAALAGDGGLDARWRLALAGVDALLDDLGFDLAAKRAFARSQRDGYGAEQRVGDALWRQLGQRYRKERSGLDALISGPRHDLLGRRSERLARLVPALRRVPVPMDELAASFVHMHVNRMLRSGHRAQEVVLHYLLERLYESQQARRRGSP